MHYSGERKGAHLLFSLNQGMLSDLDRLCGSGGIRPPGMPPTAELTILSQVSPALTIMTRRDSEVHTKKSGSIPLIRHRSKDRRKPEFLMFDISRGDVAGRNAIRGCAVKGS